MIDDSIERFVESEEIKNQRKKKKKQTFVKKYFAKKSYFQRLFPQIKEQKPGRDLYSSITLWQFIILIYLISYYTDMDAVGT